MNLLTTLKGSLLESFFPPAWDLAALDACIADDPKAILVRQPHWHAGFLRAHGGQRRGFQRHARA